MIFVTLGTQDKQFKRLPEKIEKLIKDGKIIDRVIMQVGNTKFESDLKSSKLKVIKFLKSKKITQLINDADLIITHGGVGTILEGINLGKKIIAVPRLKKYKEHVNDHQLQIIENFNANGYVIGTRGIDDIEIALERVEDFVPKKYESNNEKFIENLEKYIKNNERN